MEWCLVINALARCRADFGARYFSSLLGLVFLLAIAIAFSCQY